MRLTSVTLTGTDCAIYLLISSDYRSYGIGSADFEFDL